MEYGDAMGNPSVAQAVMGFLQQYQQAKREKRLEDNDVQDRAMKEKLAKLEMFSKGAQEDPSGGLSYTPQEQAKLDSDSNLKDAEAAKNWNEAKGGGKQDALSQMLKALEIKNKQNEIDTYNKNQDEVAGPKATAATYGNRMEQASQAMDDLSKNGYDRSSLLEEAQSHLPGFLQSGQYKQEDQAERNFENAILRRESGAAISQGEQDSASKQYFKRAGDTPDVIKQKLINQAQAIQGLKAEAGQNAWNKVGLTSAQMSSASSGGLLNPKSDVAGGGMLSNVANAATAQKPLDQMSDDELAAYEKQLLSKGRK